MCVCVCVCVCPRTLAHTCVCCLCVCVCVCLCVCVFIDYVGCTELPSDDALVLNNYIEMSVMCVVCAVDSMCTWMGVQSALV